MTTENEEGVLYSDDRPATIEDIIADVTSRLEVGDSGETVLDEDEVGPSDEGELADDDLDATDDDEDQEEDEESDEEEESSEEDDDSTTDGSEKPEGDEPKAEAKADPRDEEIANLKALVLQTQQQSQQLIDFVLRQQERQQSARSAPPKGEFDDLPEEVIQTLLFGGAEEDIKALDSATRVKGQRFVQNWTREQARYAKDPSAFYREKLQDLVRSEIRSAVGPVLQQQTVREAQSVLERHLGDMDVEAKKRVADIFQRLNSPTEEALKFAVDFVRKERKEQQLAERERKVETSERQRKANRQAARKGARRGRRSPNDNKQPRMKPGETPEQFYQRLMQNS